MDTLTDEKLLNLSRRLNDKYKFRQLGFKLRLSSYEIENHLATHSPDTSESAYSMLRSWISKINDRQVAHLKLREALMEVGLNLYNTEVLTLAFQSQGGDKPHFIRIPSIVGILIVIAAFLLGRWT